MSSSVVTIKDGSGETIGFGNLSNTSGILYPRVYADDREAWQSKWWGPHERSAWDIQCSHPQESVTIHDDATAWKGTVCRYCNVIGDGLEPD